MSPDVVSQYQQNLARRGFVQDSSQWRAVERLQRLYEEWSAYKKRRDSALKRLLVKPPLPKGVYLWGPVGRGKSFLMDAFYLCVPLVRKRRVHFHHFMREIHRELDELKGTEDPIAAVAERTARRYRLVCFDEFHVSDIADAMILGRYLEKVMDRGVEFVMTSNYAPDQLYPAGLQRERFVPAIELLKARLDVVEVDGGTDYRRLKMEQVQVYHVGSDDSVLSKIFEEVKDVEEEKQPLDVEGRTIAYRKRAGGLVWFDFTALCGGPRSYADYVDLTKRFHTVMLSGVPRMSAKQSDAARRFTWLVDVLYDERLKLVLSAEAPPEQLFIEGDNSADFQRTVSRLHEMQSAEYRLQPLREKRVTGRWARWAAAAGIAAPFALLLPRYLDLHGAWAVAVLAVLVVALFLVIGVLETRLAGAFAAIFVILVLLGFARAEHYALPDGLTDFALLFLAFYAGAMAAGVHRVLGRVVLAVAALGLVSGAIVRAAHVRLFGSPIDAEGYRAILQSSPAEAVEFVGRFVDTPLLAAAVVLLVLAGVAAWLASPNRVAARGLAWGGLGAVAAATVLFAHAELLAERGQGLTEAFGFAAELKEYRELRVARRAQAPGPEVAQRPPLAGQPQTYVFVIGESLSRNHMSLYGYWRQTTPALERLAPELVVFSDVVSPHSHTDPSLERALTLANDANRLGFADPRNYSLIDLLRAAGFDTWWISNQNRFGPWDNKTAALAAGAAHVTFLNKGSGAFVTGPYDEVLLEPFAAALAHPAPRKAIFLHFLGSHWEYHRRYPPHAAVFSAPHDPREIGARHEIQTKRHAIVQYDNAVRYHDALVARVVETLRATAQPSALVMFADHGESLFDAKGHHWKEFTRDHVEVPLVLWFSPEYRRLASDVVEHARARSRLPFALEDLPHLFADVAFLHGAVFEPARSPLSAAYRVPRERRLFDGQLVYEEANDPLLNTRRALGRITAAQPELRAVLWAHRVDTLGKMMEAAQAFDGVEIDVVFDANAGLMVNHPPQPPSGLTLDELLAYANRLQPGLRLWLDVKNLGEGNAARVVEELKRLDARHAIRTRALVETGHTGPAAALLRAAGFSSSYYLPNDVAAGKDCAGAAEIERLLAARRFAALSYDFSGRSWVERCLAGAVRKLGLKSYTWDIERNLSERAYPAALDDERRRLYPRFSGILLPFRSRFDDWR